MRLNLLKLRRLIRETIESKLPERPKPPSAGRQMFGWNVNVSKDPFLDEGHMEHMVTKLTKTTVPDEAGEEVEAERVMWTERSSDDGDLATFFSQLSDGGE
jgi:hypothetical protein